MSLYDNVSWRIVVIVIAYWLAAGYTYIFWVDCGQPTDPWSLFWVTLTMVAYPIGEPK